MAVNLSINAQRALAAIVPDGDAVALLRRAGAVPLHSARVMMVSEIPAPPGRFLHMFVRSFARSFMREGVGVSGKQDEWMELRRSKCHLESGGEV